jgi:hypothetical protein
MIFSTVSYLNVRNIIHIAYKKHDLMLKNVVSIKYQSTVGCFVNQKTYHALKTKRDTSDDHSPVAKVFQAITVVTACPIQLSYP